MLSMADSPKLPALFKVRQKLTSGEIKNIPGAIGEELDKLKIKDKLSEKHIAITAGSRGIANIPLIIRSIVDYVKAAGGNPFIVPAMGSHGGATASGQTRVLKQYGIDEDSMGCPVLSSMETVCLGKASNGAPVYFDKTAFNADGIIVCNRVKPHTDFIADNESGLVKMMAIGLGKEKGCSSMHAHGLAASLPLSCALALTKAPVLCGLAIIEDSRDQTYLIKGVAKENFLEEDAKLLKTAKSLVPSLPVAALDMLVVKEIGKIYSGTGMDTKVIGRIRVRGVPEPVRPDIRFIVALRLNNHSYGNALGIGLADITTQALVEQIDRKAMYSNLLATTYLERGKLPIYFPTEKESIETAYSLCGQMANPKIIVIENTLHLENMLVTEEVIKENPQLEVLARDLSFAFDSGGKLNI